MKKERNLKANRILVMSNVASMIAQFNMRNIEILKKLQYDVEVACNFEKGNTCTEEVIDDLKNKLKEKEISYHQIDFTRGFSDIMVQISAFKQVDDLIRKRRYNVIFVQSTIAGIVARILGKKYGCKIIYIAHGFQFYDGAPISRWFFFYNIEKIMSKKTDILILTNEDDYKLAKNKFKAKETVFVPGVGIDIKAYEIDKFFNRDKERKFRGLNSDDFVICSAGELTERKNHRIVMEIIKEINNPKIKYLICGIGTLEEEYKNMIKSQRMTEQIYLLGYQKDLKTIYGISDLFILPSINEGLPVCLLMSIAAKVNSVCSDIRGNHELVRNKQYLFSPQNKEEIRKSIEYAMSHEDSNKAVIEENYRNLQKYSSENVDCLMKEVFNKYR